MRTNRTYVWQPPLLDISMQGRNDGYVCIGKQCQDPKMEARRGVRMINSSVWRPESQIVEFLRFIKLFARIFFFFILRYIIDCDVQICLKIRMISYVTPWTLHIPYLHSSDDDSSRSIPLMFTSIIVFTFLFYSNEKLGKRIAIPLQL